MSNGLGTNEIGNPVMGCAVADVAPVNPAAPKEKVNPILKPAKLTVVVKKFFTDAAGAKKAYTSPKRHPVVLSTDKAFDGKATFNRSSDRIKFFRSANNNDEIKFNGIDNVFNGSLLKSGVTLYAEGAQPSAALDDVKLTLQLSGGSKDKGPDATATATSVEVTLDICKPRTSAAADPPTLSQAEKINPGRAIHVQNSASRHLRAMLIVGPVKPAAFK